ncbi:MAG: DUF4062 domain-containing protein [Candidatus Marinimicrobia bacterium]|nr:DUF4062 domain-containing protein [Candidatus Neomarinimicrobiota bacterium]
MIPNIFISSTIKDLHHLRDHIRDVVEDLGYTPIMSEFGDVGYLIDRSVIDSAYSTVKECSLMILIIAKNYGFITSNDLSVTHNEYRAARDSGKPIICFVDDEVNSYKKVSEINSEDLDYPDMDNPEKTFDFIREVSQSSVNNAIMIYSHSSDMGTLLKKQMANWFGDFLNMKSSPMKSDIKDVLSEVRTLRNELLKGKDPIKHMRSVRKLLEDTSVYIKNLFEGIFGTLEDGVKKMMEYDSLQEMLEGAVKNVKILEYLEIVEMSRTHTEGRASFWSLYDHQADESGELEDIAAYYLRSPDEIYINSAAINNMNIVFDSIKSIQSD